MPPSARSCAPILVFALPDDPFAAALRARAEQQGLPLWQPADLAEVGWAVTLDGDGADVRLIDRKRGCIWPSDTLAGIWFQALPPLATIDRLEERDRQYVIAEVRSSLIPVWRSAACPVIGQPRSDPAAEVLGTGPEARIALSRLGLPAAKMTVGRERMVRQAQQGQCVRITSLTNGESFWLDGFNGAQDRPPVIERSTAIASEHRAVRVLVIAGQDLRTVDVRDAGAVSGAEPTAEDATLAARIRAVTGLELVLAFCSRQEGAWRITRLSAQVPWWLAEVPGMASWIGSWLVGRFVPGSRHAAAVSGGDG